MLLSQMCTIGDAYNDWLYYYVVVVALTVGFFWIVIYVLVNKHMKELVTEDPDQSVAGKDYIEKQELDAINLATKMA